MHTQNKNRELSVTVEAVGIFDQPAFDNRTEKYSSHNSQAGRNEVNSSVETKVRNSNQFCKPMTRKNAFNRKILQHRRVDMDEKSSSCQ